ncbi:MAG: TetR/AcrR family transcriptional regulator, partial [Gammaproteobacteria bacterium]|nr:TetR/AcrR family transcriptional regulator [Gammaproteobacteria bacterium]
MIDPAAPKTYHHGNLRAELLDTAIQQLRDLGTEDLSLRALARAVGVSQTAPYRHFADKGELLAAMATRGYRDLLAALRAAGDRTP